MLYKCFVFDGFILSKTHQRGGERKVDEQRSKFQTCLIFVAFAPVLLHGKIQEVRVEFPSNFCSRVVVACLFAVEITLVLRYGLR